jgi:hypothetical protein
MVQWFKWLLGRFRKMGGIYVAFLSFSLHTYSFLFLTTCALFSHYIFSLSFFGPSQRSVFGLVFVWGFLLLSGFLGFGGFGGGFGYVLTVYADAIHDIKMRFMSRCFLQCVASQPAWFSTASAVHLLPPRLAFSSAIIMSLGGGVTGDRLI